MQRIMSWTLVLVLSTTLLSSCLKSSTTEPEKLTYLYLMHMAPTAPAVDLYFGSQKASTSAIGYNTISGSYAGIRPATFDVTYKKGGADSVVATIPIAVYDTSRPYTLLLYSDDLGKGQATKIYDNVADVNADKMNFRFWHLAHDVAEVDLYLGTTKVDAGRSLADNVGGNYFNTFSPFEPGTYTITVKEAGTSTVLATAEEANLVRGGVYTIFLKGEKATATGTKALAVGVVRNF